MGVKEANLCVQNRIILVSQKSVDGNLDQSQGLKLSSTEFSGKNVFHILVVIPMKLSNRMKVTATSIV